VKEVEERDTAHAGRRVSFQVADVLGLSVAEELQVALFINILVL
jgi:hypothetical protein